VIVTTMNGTYPWSLLHSYSILVNHNENQN